MPSKRDHAKQVRSYDDVYLACRDLRHVWEIVGFYRDAGVIRRLLECSRCGTQREDKWRLSGEREGSRYSYAESFHVRGGMDYFEVRKEVMHRATIYASQTAMVKALAEQGKTLIRRHTTEN